MIKSLGVLLGGVFVGAVGIELIRKKYPNALNGVYAKARYATNGAVDAFKKGYEKAVHPEPAAQPG